MAAAIFQQDNYDREDDAENVDARRHHDSSKGGAMGVLDRFEKGVERALSSTFARAFKADLKPVDIASALRNEMDDRAASLSRGRTVVPNIFVIELASADQQRVEEWGEQELIHELVNAATSHAADQGYVFVGPVHVTIEDFPEFKAGEFTIRSSSAHPQDPALAQEVVAQEASEQHGFAPEGSAPQGFAQQGSEGHGFVQHGSAQPASWQQAEPQPPQPAQISPTSLHAQPIIDVEGQRYLLTGARTVLGRGSEADIILSDTGVSREHLEIQITPGGVIATDLGSTNGTFIEGHRIDAATLVDGNTITIGRTRITFWAGSSTPSAGDPA